MSGLRKNYDFSLIADSVDRNNFFIKCFKRGSMKLIIFVKIIKTFTKECFIPISAGGKISNLM